MGLELITPPSGELIPAQELLDWVRADDIGPNRDELTRLIKAAETSFQEYSGRQLRVATYRWTRSLFSSQPMRFPFTPVLAVSQVRYLDAAAAWQIIDAADYQTTVNENFTYLLTAPLASWPTVESGRANAVEITFTAGMYDSVERPDEEIVLRLKSYVAQFFGKRLPDAADDDWLSSLWLPWDSGELA
jgi:hypothetical protein